MINIGIGVCIHTIVINDSDCHDWEGDVEIPSGLGHNLKTFPEAFCYGIIYDFDFK